MKKITLSILSTLCFVVTLWSQCTPPTNLSVSNVTGTTAVVSWMDANNALSFNIQLAANGTTIGTSFVTNTSPYVFTGLSCSTTYTVQVAANCDNANNSSPFSAPITFTTLPCTATFGQPQNMTNCIGTNGLACFYLNNNTTYILGNADPTQYSVTYHASQADAAANINPLPSPYCVSAGTYTLFSRVTQNSDGTAAQINVFTITATTAQLASNLDSLVLCDDNGDGVIVADLTTSQALINSLNPISYFTTFSNAQNNINPITNPSALSFAVSVNATTIFIREDVPNGCDNIYSRTVITHSNCNLASACINANSLCGSLGVPFINTVGSPSSGSSGCLGSTPNATWFYLPISQSGTIDLKVTQGNNAPSYNNLDVDYIIYGPFTSPTGGCTSYGPSNIVSCSYSAASTEYPTITNAQAGKYYLMMVTNFSNQAGFITINSLPTSTGVINCTGFTFNAFLDANNNGVKDSGELNFPLGEFQYEKNNDGVLHNITSPTGTVYVYDNIATNSYNVNFTVNPVYAANYSVSPASYSGINPGAGMITYYFPVTATSVYNDIAVTVIPMNIPRPGFNYYNKVVYTNLGTQTVANGTVTFTKPAAVTITSTTPTTTSNATGFTYNFTNLAPFEVRTIDVTMLVPPIPTVNANDYLVSSASIEPLAGDLVPSNNTSTVNQIVVNAYDPNDKMESHGPQIVHSTFTSNDYLYYTIRFENTGNAAAINIRVNDVLNSQLDETTLQMISSSHAYVLDRIGTNLTWSFNNIQLPVSVANTMIGKGYITFKIKPKAGYAVGDIIPNAASIYFDYNPAIVTNTFTTEFVAFLASPAFDTDSIRIYPNPTSDILNIELLNNQTIQSLVIYDLLGNKIVAKNYLQTPTQINISNLASGIFLLELTDTNNQKLIHKIVKK